jgi:hypothetical protein
VPAVEERDHEGRAERVEALDVVEGMRSNTRFVTRESAMEIDGLIKLIAATINKAGGSLYTSTKLRDNPDVCHAACTWFLSSFEKGKNFKEIVQFLDQTDKKTFKLTQEQVMAGVKQPGAIAKVLKEKGPANVSDEDIAAVKWMIEHWSQPKAYSKKKPEVVEGIVNLMRTKADRVMIYINGKKGGHVICAARNVGGIAIYDPNIGIITAALRETDTWGGVLTMILGWYEQEMKLDEFAFLQK